jgi:NADH:ubiquinone oxidoreductase subunit K
MYWFPCSLFIKNKARSVLARRNMLKMFTAVSFVLNTDKLINIYFLLASRYLMFLIASIHCVVVIRLRYFYYDIMQYLYCIYFRRAEDSQL